MRPFFVMCTLLLFIHPALSVEKIVVWERNYNKPFFKETLQNLAQLSDEEFGQLNIVPLAKNIVADLNLVFIYPNTYFIFISPKNIKLHERLSTAMGLAIEDNNYFDIFDIFDKYYESALIENGIYERKLMILKKSKVISRSLVGN